MDQNPNKMVDEDDFDGLTLHDDSSIEEDDLERAAERRQQREILVGKETKVIVRLQRTVFTFLVVIGLTCSILTYFILEAERQRDSETQVRIPTRLSSS